MARICKCGETDSNKFSKKSRNPDGLDSRCLACIKKARANQYTKHKSYYLAKARKQQEINRKRGKERHYTINSRFSYAKSRALKKGKGWLIPFEEYKKLVEQPCHYCSNKLAPEKASGVGLDRIDNSKGYELTNVLPCCGICNSIRNDYLSVQETEVAVRAIVLFRSEELKRT
jgi:hypothetical protein